ncbi:MAG: response regulator, partial [Eubacterium callanderi]
MRILFIEDEVKITDALQELCKIQNIDCDVANDGEEGLLFALNPIYDVIVLDIMLPMKSGLEILKEVRDRDITT